MEAEEFTDICHYLYEEDLIDSTTGPHESHLRKDAIRKAIYEKLYEQEYRIAGSETQSSSIPETAHGWEGDNDSLDEELDRLAAAQVTAPAKKYVPPTEMNADSPKPFGSVLDPPVG